MQNYMVHLYTIGNVNACNYASKWMVLRFIGGSFGYFITLPTASITYFLPRTNRNILPCVNTQKFLRIYVTRLGVS